MTNKILYDPDKDILYTPTKTGLRFHESDDTVKCIRGPVGGGKSSTCCNHVLYRAKQQQPHPDGIRRTKGLIIRNTYSELTTTTIETWQRWFPPHIFGEPKGKCPIRHRIKFGDVDMLVIFMAIDKMKDLKKFKSLDITWAWLNEASELPRSIFDKATERVNRYPLDRRNGVIPTHPEVILDTNSPDENNWIYEIFEQNSFEGYRIFAQPPAMVKEGDKYRLNPNAENLENLAPDYYQHLIRGKDENYIQTMIMNQYGFQKFGKPVYEKTYNDTLHCPEGELILDTSLPIGLGWDFGRNPACSIVQRQSAGNIIDIAELHAEDMSFENFLDNFAVPFIFKNFSGYSFDSVGDPSGRNRAGTNDSNAFDALKLRGLPTIGAPSNDPAVRIAAVEFFLTRLIGGAPGYQISRKCPHGRKGFINGYCYEQLKIIGEERFKETPKKNYFSHIHDAKQYILLYYRTLSESQRSKTFKKSYSKYSV